MATQDSTATTPRAILQILVDPTRTLMEPHPTRLSFRERYREIGGKHARGTDDGGGRTRGADGGGAAGPADDRGSRRTGPVGGGGDQPGRLQAPQLRDDRR